MTRTYAVTGAASGIGQTTANLLREQGHTVVGIDLRDADVIADLSDPASRATLADQVAEAGGAVLDGVLAVAGVSALNALTVKVNFFGAQATLANLRPLLAKSAAPRAAVVASFSTLQDVDAELVALMTAGDEAGAVAYADGLDELGVQKIYASTKRAIVEWIRTVSITPEWAGAGIPINAVGPGVILTPMMEPFLATEEGRTFISQMVPMPLHGPMDAVVIARTLAWLTSEENSHMTGQAIFVDGGADVSLRGPRIFG